MAKSSLENYNSLTLQLHVEPITFNLGRIFQELTIQSAPRWIEKEFLKIPDIQSKNIGTQTLFSYPDLKIRMNLVMLQDQEVSR